MMRSLVLLFLPLLMPVGNMFGQYCVSVGPNSAIDSNVESVQISGASGSITYSGCPGVIGLQDLTGSTMVTLNAGATYSISIRWGTCGGIFAGAGTAWIDYNGNYIFESSEAIASWQGTPPVTQVYNFTVPAGAQNGVTRMRVTQQEGTNLPLNPCANFAWGSVTDFGVSIGNGIDCSGYIGDDTNDPVVVSTLPYSATGDNSFCYSNQNLVYASPDVYYLVNPTPLMQSISVSLCGSSFDTFLSVVDTDGNIIAFNDDAEGCGTSSALNFDTEGLGQIFIIVEGWGSEMGEYDISINANFLDVGELDDWQIELFPNPVSDELNIHGFEGKLVITDLAGKIIFRLENFDSTKLDVSSLVEGVYILVGYTDKGTVSDKFIIKR